MDSQLLLKQLLSKTEAQGDCMEWTGMRNRAGYGVVSIFGRKVIASRAVFELANGTFHCWMCVCHRCDNPPCVNPDHLFLGTHKDNIKDAQFKGRLKTNLILGRFGSDNGNARLTEEQVLEIRAIRAKHGTAYKELATLYSVAPQTIRQICLGERWKKLIAAQGAAV